MYAGNLYGYTPTLVGGVIFTLLFTGTTAYHLFQLSKARCWYFIPFVVGGVCKSSHPRIALLSFDKMSRKKRNQDKGKRKGPALTHLNSPDYRIHLSTRCKK